MQLLLLLGHLAADVNVTSTETMKWFFTMDGVQEDTGSEETFLNIAKCTGCPSQCPNHKLFWRQVMGVGLGSPGALHIA